MAKINNARTRNEIGSNRKIQFIKFGNEEITAGTEGNKKQCVEDLAASQGSLKEDSETVMILSVKFIAERNSM